MIAYFDCFSGISGDMTLGALVDAGVPVEQLRSTLSLLPVSGYDLEVKKTTRCGFRATKVDVVLKKESTGTHQDVKRWKDIQKIITTSELSEKLKIQGLDLFKRLFQAEAHVHGGRYDRVHLHELGAIDCIVDIFGALIGLDILGIDKVYASRINLGTGNIKSEHGLLPVPAPASVELLKGIPVYSSEINFELTTPTGAVLISSLASGFGPLPEMKILKTGIGAGNKDFTVQPNILRLLIGEHEEKQEFSGEEITVIETNIDDMNPQVYEYAMDKLFSAGALDVFLSQIIMKKGRPAIKMTVLCNEDDKDALMDILFTETTTIGMRFYNAERKVLQREISQIDTKFGKVRVKTSSTGSAATRRSLEYDDCRQIAEKFNIPLIEVFRVINGDNE